MANVQAGAWDALMRIAASEAFDMRHEFIGTEHLLLAMFRTNGVETRALEAAGAKYEALKLVMMNNIGKGNATEPPRKQSPRAMAVLQQARSYAQMAGDRVVNAAHVLLALIDDSEGFSNIMMMLTGVDKRLIKKHLIEFTRTQAEKKSSTSSKEGNQVEQYARNLNTLAQEGKIDPVIGREKEIERIIQVLMRRKKNNPVLIGEPGVGKTAIAEGLAERIVNADVPEVMLEKTIYSLDMTSMIAGTKFRGDFESRIKDLIEELQKMDDVILFIDEFHTIIGAGNSEGAMDAANILKPVLARGEIQVIGATTVEEYRKHVEKDTALERRLQPIMVDPPSVEETQEIIRGLRGQYEDHHEIKIRDEAIDAAVELSERYIADRYLPDKAIDLIDEACARARVLHPKTSVGIRKMEAELESLNHDKDEAARSQKFEKAADLRDQILELEDRLEQAKTAWAERHSDQARSIGFDEIASIVSDWSKVPVSRMTEEETARYRFLDVNLNSRVIGQEEAVQALSFAIKRARVGLKDPNKPIGSFIFVGPTGVGKTYLAKMLAEELFGSQDAMIRIDMSEFMEKHTVSRLIGSPPGYVGYDEGGQLTEAIRQKPYSVLLFDEIEKAHPDVFNILLQIMDEGHVTDAQGRRVSFKNTVLIMTSNVGASLLQTRSTLGFVKAGDQKKTEYENMKQIVEEALKNTFRPEFLNRVDDTVVFQVLDEQATHRIAQLKVAEMKTHLRNLGYEVEITDAVVDYIATKGFDKSFGARPLDRLMQTDIDNKLAEAILEGRVSKDASILIDVEDDRIVFDQMTPFEIETIENPIEL